MTWFLSQNWSGLVLAFIIAIVGTVLSFISGLMPTAIVSSGLMITGGFLLLLSVLLGFGAVYHLFMVAKYTAKHPPQGRMVDVGGYKMHILAEGSGDLPVVWIPGSHDDGNTLYNLHKELRKEHRSILFDRPGSGYSELGPFPRTVAVEAKELHILLKNSGEIGPFIFAGHSLGGLLAQNYADLYPEDVAGLVLLDSACPDASIYTRGMKENKVPGAGSWMWFAAAFGLLWIVFKREKKKQAQWLSIYDDDIQEKLIFSMAQPKNSVAFINALKTIGNYPFLLVKGHEALGNIPIFAIIPPVTVDDQIKEISVLVPRFNEREVENFVRLRIDAQHQNARLSSCGELHYSPEGTTHGFPYEAPEFTLEEVRKMIALVSKQTTT